MQRTANPVLSAKTFEGFQSIMYLTIVYISLIVWLIAGTIANADDTSNDIELIIPPELEQVEPSRVADAIELVAKVTGMRIDSSTIRDIVWVKISVEQKKGIVISAKAEHWTLMNLWLDDVAEIVSIMAIDNAKSLFESALGSWYYQPVAFTLFIDDDAVDSSSQEEVQIHVEAMPIYFEEIEFSNEFTKNNSGGKVFVFARIGRKGKLIDAIIPKTSGVDSLDQTVLALAKKSRFTPAFVNGKPEARLVLYQITFRNYNDTLKSTTTFKSSMAYSKNVETSLSDYNHIPTIDEFVPVEIMPEMIYEVHPEYPRLARQAGLSGRVWIKALVGIDGRVKEAVVAKSSGKPALDKAALQVAYLNLFSPGIQDGRPVAVWIAYKVDYMLSK